MMCNCKACRWDGEDWVCFNAKEMTRVQVMVRGALCPFCRDALHANGTVTRNPPDTEKAPCGPVDGAQCPPGRAAMPEPTVSKPNGSACGFRPTNGGRDKDFCVLPRLEGGWVREACHIGRNRADCMLGSLARALYDRQAANPKEGEPT